MARGSALEMEFKRGRFRLSLFSDQPEVRPASLPPPAPRSSSPGCPGPPPPPQPARTRRGGDAEVWVLTGC